MVELSPTLLLRETRENVQICGAALCETIDGGQGKLRVGIFAQATSDLEENFGIFINFLDSPTIAIIYLIIKMDSFVAN